MGKGLKRLKAMVRLEIETSYRFPILEGLLAFVLFVCTAYSVQYGLSFAISASDASFVLDCFQSAGARYLFNATTSFTTFLTFIMPMLVSVVVAKPIEDGTLQAYLSYPMGRTNLLVTKIGLAIIIPSSFLTVSILTALFLVFPVFPQPTELSLVLFSIWSYISLLSISSTIFALIFRRASITSVLGVGMWFTIYTALVVGGVSPVVTSVLCPLLASITFITGQDQAPTIEQLGLGLPLTWVAIIALLIVAVAWFRRMEI